MSLVNLSVIIVATVKPVKNDSDTDLRNTRVDDVINGRRLWVHSTTKLSDGNGGPPKRRNESVLRRNNCRLPTVKLSHLAGRRCNTDNGGG